MPDDALRGEMNTGFDGLRAEMNAGDDALRGEMNTGFDGLRAEMNAGDDALRGEMNTGFDGLRAEMNAGDDALRGEMNIDALRVDMQICRPGSRSSIRALEPWSNEWPRSKESSRGCS